MSLLEIKDLRHSYPKVSGAKTVAVSNISFDINRDEVLCIVGKSGCGKTTLLKIISGLIVPDGGKVLMKKDPSFDSFEDITEKPTHKRDIGFVFQSNKALFPHMNVFENVEFPFKYGNRGNNKDEWIPKVNRIIERVGLGSVVNNQIHELSGGMKQRVAIARALVYRPSLLILDEPLTSLDNSRKDSILEMLLDIKSEIRNSVIHVTHDDREVKTVSDRVLVMKNGNIIRIDETEKILNKPNRDEVKDLLRV